MKFLFAFFILISSTLALADEMACEKVWLATSASATKTSVENFDIPLVRKNRFATSRGLGEYGSDLSKEFMSSLDSLSRNDIWIDFGAGNARAAEDYLSLKSKDLLNPNAYRFASLPTEERANVLAITYKYNRWFPKYQGSKLQIYKDKFFEEYESIPEYKLGSDDYGVFSYTKRPDYYLHLAINRMQTDGKLFIYSDFKRTIIQTRSGERISALEWIKRISGLNTQTIGYNLVIIQKPTIELEIPSLRLIKYEEDFPPIRVFEEIDQ